MDNTIQLYSDREKKNKVYPITSPDRVIDENGVNIKDKIEEINSSLDNITNIDDFFKGDILLIPTYNSNKGIGKNNLRFYISNNFKDFYNVNNNPIFTSKTNKANWNYAGLLHNNEFLFISDYQNNSSVFGGDTFNLIRTDDFNSFIETDIKFNNHDRQWAPELYVENGEIYIISTLQKSKGTRPSTAYPKYMSTYISKALDNTLNKWSEPIEIIDTTAFIGDDGNPISGKPQYIDPCLIKKDGIYYLFLTSEIDNKYNLINVFTNTSLTSKFTFSHTIDFAESVEAPSCIKINGLYYLYCDAHPSNKGSGKYVFKTSVDLINWSDKETVNTFDGNNIRHFSPILISDEGNKNKVKELMKRCRENNSILANTINEKFKNLTKPLNYENLSNICVKEGNDGIIQTLYAKGNTVYRLGHDNNNVEVDKIIINNINTDNVLDGEFIGFVVDSSSRDIIIKHGGSVYLPSKKDFAIGFKYGNNESIIKFDVRDGYLKATNTSPLAIPVKNPKVYDEVFIDYIGNIFDLEAGHYNFLGSSMNILNIPDNLKQSSITLSLKIYQDIDRREYEIFANVIGDKYVLYTKNNSNEFIHGWRKEVYTSEGYGSPEGVVTSSQGHFYRDLTNYSLYFKLTGVSNTGWKEITLK